MIHAEVLDLASHDARLTSKTGLSKAVEELCRKIIRVMEHSFI
jgi:hypothetical protein